MSSRAVTVGRSLGSSERSSSVPTPDATRREDHVVDLVISDLVRSGRSVTLLDRPDRNAERTDGLTVDAELLVDGQRWAMDVTTLRWRSGLEGAVEKLKVRLKREFGADLDATGRTLVMTCHVSADEDVIRSLVELARSAVMSGQNQERNDEAASLWPRTPELGAVIVQPWLGQSANLQDEIVLSSGQPLGKKLRGQQSGARALGYRTCLAIDQRGAPDLRFGANFMPHPETIAAAVEQVEVEAGAPFDLLALIRDDDTVRWLRS